MKIYLASTAPGTEATNGKICKIPLRLLSFYSIITEDLYCNVIFKFIKRGLSWNQ